MRMLKSCRVFLFVAGAFLQASPASTAPNSVPAMDALLTTIVTWLSANYELPAIYDHPTVQRMPVDQLSDFRYKAIARSQRREVVAVYDDVERRILLTENWQGKTAADISILVHEMVHHLQNLANHNHDCPAQRERLAYGAQAKWLALFGLTLQHAFDIDQTTLLITTACPYP